MISFNDISKKYIEKHNPNWPYIPDHPYKISIIGNPGSGKTNSLFDLINHQPYMIKFICMLRIHMKQNINFKLTNEKVQDQSNLVILKLLLNNQMIWMIFIKILKNTTQTKN